MGNKADGGSVCCIARQKCGHIAIGIHRNGLQTNRFTFLCKKSGKGKLSLLTRKVFNVMMYHAQELKDPGVNAPIDTPSAKKYFWMRLSDLARDAHYDSKDTEFLKAQLEELQNIKLLMENERPAGTGPVLVKS